MKRHGEAGAALLSVLILVGVMGAIAATMFDRLRLATLLGSNAGVQDQARAQAMIAETLATARIDDLLKAAPGKTTLRGDWNGRTTTLPLPGGPAQLRVDDGGNCFNLNSLVLANGPEMQVSRPVAVAQFIALMRLRAVPEAAARRIAAATADWIDSDDRPNPDGAEDAAYRGRTPAYRTANALLAEVSELRAVDGVTPEIYARVRPMLCALPLAELSPINVNTLGPTQAPLVAMLLPETVGSVDARLRLAARVLAERPENGWDEPQEFWNTPALRDDVVAGDGVFEQVQVRTRWFALAMRINSGDTVLRETALIDARRPPARIVTRRWTEDE